MEPVRFVAVGDVMVDVVVSGSGHDAHVRLAAGGTAVNATSTAALQGSRAEVIGRIGDDAAGRMVLAELVERGVRTTVTLDPERPTGTFLVVDGEVRVDRGANLGLAPDDLPTAIEADVVLVSGHLPRPVVAAALERASGTWIALAPGTLHDLPEGGNALFLDEDEARALTGTEAAAAARTLGERYRLVCVTRGREGAIGVLDAAAASMSAPAVVDGRRPGAGDAFAAATLGALARSASFRDALAAGCRAGARAVAE